jgi:hypothetical protein
MIKRAKLKVRRVLEQKWQQEQEESDRMRELNHYLDDLLAF